jgi:hypothetical protein
MAGFLIRQFVKCKGGFEADDTVGNLFSNFGQPGMWGSIPIRQLKQSAG